MNSDVASISVIGAGLIGKRHIHHINREAKLASVVDPDPSAQKVAEEFGVPHFSTISDMLSAGGADGAVVATPNQLHETHGIECLRSNLPILVEKPITSDVASAENLVSVGEERQVPILVGHHRRHNPLIAKAKSQIEAGALGDIQAVQGSCWLFKPDEYFETAWRVGGGAGPILINLIHDIDLLRHLCGDISTVQALKTNRVRCFEVEETAAIMMQFRSGCLCVLSISDVIVGPWSWELTSGENSAYPSTNQSCYLIGGTHGSLSLPDLSFWANKGVRSWWEPISRTSIPHSKEDPLALQIRHFSDVCLGKAKPIVSGRDGLETLRVVEAILKAAETGQTINVGTNP